MRLRLFRREADDARTRYPKDQPTRYGHIPEIAAELTQPQPGSDGYPKIVPEIGCYECGCPTIWRGPHLVANNHYSWCPTPRMGWPPGYDRKTPNPRRALLLTRIAADPDVYTQPEPGVSPALDQARAVLDGRLLIYYGDGHPEDWWGRWPYRVIEVRRYGGHLEALIVGKGHPAPPGLVEVQALNAWTDITDDSLISLHVEGP